MATSPQPKQGPVIGKAPPRPRSFLHNDFPFIRKASIELGLSIALAAILVAGSAYLLAKQQDKQNQAQAKRNDARDKTAEVESEKREIQDFQPKYAQLVARGFVGEEKRLDWIEGMKAIQEKRKLLPIAYEISPQLPVQGDETLQTGSLELRASKMVLHMDLLHEMDMLNFLEDLKSKGFYATQSCLIKPASVSRIGALTARLGADCTLYWLTLGQRDKPEGEAPPVPAPAPVKQ